jgi:Ankyrin repeat
MSSPQAINPAYRPFEYLHPTFRFIGTILGDTRRSTVIQAVSEGWADELPPSFFAIRLKPDDLEHLVRTRGPVFRAGEDLPAFRDDEVEIARLTIDPVTPETVTIRATEQPGRITYRVVSEPQGKYTWPIESSAGPLTLNELTEAISQLRIAGDDRPLLETWWRRLTDAHGDVSAAIEQVKAVSIHYRQLNDWYHIRALSWAESQARTSCRLNTKLLRADAPQLLPLHRAAIDGDTERIEGFLEAGTEVDRRLPARADRPSLRIGFNCNIGLRQRLLRLVNARPSVLLPRATPLLLAAANGHGNVVQTLLEAGADPTLTDVEGRNAAQVAEEHGHRTLAGFIDGYPLAAIKRSA